jgi:bifunctional non-homologous end joining protein LigD
VLFPATGTTKRDLCRYYTEVAPVLLPHLRDRPVTLRRAPDGPDGSEFFQKHRPRGTPPWIPTIEVSPSGDPGGGSETDRGRRAGGPAERIAFAGIDSLPALVWAANLAAIELHVPMWRVGPDMVPRRPDLMVFDLDPGPSTSIVHCCEVALEVRQALAADGWSALAKTSGSKGLQLYVRVGSGRPADTLAYARDLAGRLQRLHPATVVSNMRRDLRRGKVLIDWSQNHPAKTTIAPYSVRIRAEPWVSTPVSWDEVAGTARDGDAAGLRFDVNDVAARVRSGGDLFAPLTGRRTTPAPREAPAGTTRESRSSRRRPRSSAP